ncbi:POK7 protein, partial [Dicrurus megarhynchus]|nr:POK7 protein [Dicrurus megarhynchus]
ASECPGFPSMFQQAKLSHQMYHQNALTLVGMFHLTHDQARAIVATCPQCQLYQLPSLGSGVNPRGLNTGELRQTDATHIPAFGRQKYVHVSIVTFLGVIFASAHTGEKAKDVIIHFHLAFATLSVPAEVKMDNGPAHTSGKLYEFFDKWGIRHSMGIPPLSHR